MEKIQKDELFILFEQEFGEQLPDELLEKIAVGRDGKNFGECISYTEGIRASSLFAGIPVVTKCWKS